MAAKGQKQKIHFLYTATLNMILYCSPTGGFALALGQHTCEEHNMVNAGGGWEGFGGSGSICASL